VDAPEGTEARKRPSVVVTSTSTVGIPRLSITSLPRTEVITDMEAFDPIDRKLRELIYQSNEKSELRYNFLLFF
jgi:hypothetical protein